MSNLSKTFGLSDCRVGFSPPIPTKKSGKLTIPLLVLLTICFSALPAQAKYGGGKGEPNDPYLIFNANHMNAIGEDSNDWDKHFKLRADIDLSSFTGTAFNIIGNYTSKFTGVFDGNGHTISNLTYNTNGVNFIGLFGYVDGPYAEIKNLGLIDPNIDAGTGFCVGSLVGWINDGAITGCYVRSGSVTGQGGVGGLVGYNGSTITSCYSTGSVTGNSSVGGLVGDNQGTASASFWDIDTSGQATSAGGTGKTTAEMQTADIFLAWVCCDCDPVWTIDEGNDYPRLWWQNAPGEPITIQLCLGNSGTQPDPYLIYTADQLNAIGLLPCAWDKHFKLMDDIDLSGYTGTAFNIIGNDATPFTGVFDGNGHTISNFSYTSTGTSQIGLFGYVDDPNAEIKDLGLIATDVDAGTGSNVGSLVGRLRGGTITNCYVQGGSVSGATNVGGLAGYNITDPSLFLDYTANPISADLRDISITGTSVILEDDQVTSAIPLPFNFYFYGTQFSEVFISSNGFITFLSSSSDGCCSGQTLPDSFIPNALIAGFWEDLLPPEGGTIRYQTLGSEDRREFVIGFYEVPHFPGDFPVTFEIILHEGTNNIELQYGSAPSDGGTHSVGIENFNGTDALQVAFGDVSFDNEGFLITGCGLVESSNGGISNCYATASVTGTTDIGGLVGWNYGTISDSYSTGSASGDDEIGGLVGRNFNTITNCYSTGGVTGTGWTIGGLVGDNLGTVSTSFWDIQTSGQTASAGGTGKTTDQMQDHNTFMDAGWDFVGKPDGPHDIWAEPSGGGYPILWWQISPLPALPTFSGGTGTADEPYLISTPDELNSIGHNPRLMESHFKLINDIDLAGIDLFIIGRTIYPFAGTFNGSNFEISNFSYTSTDMDNIGLFSYVECPDAEIKDLGLLDPDIDAGTGDYVGSLVGRLDNGTITNCCVQGGSASGNSRVGGLVGENDGTITSSYATTGISGENKVGGLVGQNHDTITNSYATGDVLGARYVGGLVGYNISEPSVFLYTANTISADLRDISITGTSVILEDDEVTGEIPLPFNFYFYGTEFSELFISSNGFITFLSDEDDGCCSGQALPDSSYPNGLIAGFWEDLDPPERGTICYQTLGAEGSRDFVIGFYQVPHCDGNSPVTFEIILHEGTNNIELQYGSAPSNGGIHSAGIENLNGTDGLQVAFGDVSFDNEGFLITLEGFVEERGGSISNCYSTGSVPGTEWTIGGLVGWNYEGTVTDSFWDIETSGQTTSAGGTGLPTDEMQMASTFTDAGWDFTIPIWIIDEGVDYPRLWSQTVPVLHSEPEITLGTTNTITWDPVPGANDYYAECAEDANFTSIVYSTGWITETSYEFTGLQLGQKYWYTVKAANSAGVESRRSNVESSLQGTLADVVETLLDPDTLKNKNMKKALLNKINAVLKMLDEGLYEEALDKLQDDILAKMNGCAETGRPDKNDWIITCEEQSRLYPFVIETIEYVSGLMNQ